MANAIGRTRSRALSRLRPILTELRAQPLRAIAAELNARNIDTQTNVRGARRL